MHRKNILEQVKKIVSERSDSHGNPQENLSMATALKETLRGGSSYLKLKAAEREAMDQIMTKASRMVCGTPGMQHWEDIIGYASIGGECRSKANETKQGVEFYDNLTAVNVDAPMARKVRK